MRAKPAGAGLGLTDIGESVRQVVEAMRSGANPTAHAFGPIVLVGHSAGSIAATYAQANSNVADTLNSNPPLICTSIMRTAGGRSDAWIGRSIPGE